MVRYRLWWILLGATAGLATAILSSGFWLGNADANVYERPPGADYDFVHCTKPTENIRRRSACAALGLLECRGRITGNAFLVRAEGGEEVIVTAAHAFLHPAAQELESDCRFLLQGSEPGMEIDRAVLMSRTAHKSAKYLDLAAARLSNPQGIPFVKIQLEPVTQNELAELVLEPTYSFAILAIDPYERVPVATAYPCGPVPKETGHRLSRRTAEFNHNCPAIPGFSGSPGMAHIADSGKYTAICVDRAELGPDGRHPFDLRLNPNTCTAISPEFIEVVNRLAQDEPVVAPEGGAVIDFRTTPPE